MAIRTFKAADFDKIAKTDTTVQSDAEPVISGEQLQYLYEKAINELAICEEALLNMHELFSEMFCNHEILANEEVLNFFMFMNSAINCIIPAVLEGDHEKTFKYCNDELTEDDLDEARLELYTKLYDRYLK